VAQRFRRPARFTRNGIDYVFGDLRTLNRHAAACGADVVHVNGLNFAADVWLLRRALPRTAAIVVQDHGSIAPSSSVSPVRAIRRAIRLRGLRGADGFF